jgi:hypothetical protein
MKSTPYTRTQVLLEPQQAKLLAEIAAAEGKSLSSLLREMIDAALQQRRQQELARAAEHMMDTYTIDGEILGYSTLDRQDFLNSQGA